MNRIELKGNVGTVRVNDTPSGRMVRLSIATNYLYKTKDGEAGVETTWLNVVAWEGKYVQDIDKIAKGSFVHAVGRMRASKYTGSDGVERMSYEVVANRLAVIEGDEDN